MLSCKNTYANSVNKQRVLLKDFRKCYISALSKVRDPEAYKIRRI